jgi:sulfoxide reductase heme-binding subunit YedZ
MTRRILRHHLPIALLSAVGMAALLRLSPGKGGVQTWSIASAYVGLVLMGATLVTGPFAILRGRRHPTSSDLRRDLGIWAAVFALGHFVFGLQVHMKHRYLYWFREMGASRVPTPRIDPFGLTNDMGLAAVVIAVVLLAISNDLSLRKLGATRWKRIQQWNYWFVALVLAHGVIFQVIEKRTWGFLLFEVVIVSVPACLQLAGFRARRAASGWRSAEAAASDPQ